MSPRVKERGRANTPLPRWWTAGLCTLLAAAVWGVFGQTLRHEFVNYDDDLYVYENAVIQKGLTYDGLRWALTHGQIGHWHPLAWISHMVDCELYGSNPRGHHFTNVLLHATAVIFLFLVLTRLTGAIWHSAFVAFVFAVHPLRAESVAWVAERKDVLSGVFFMLTLAAYGSYVRKPRSLLHYLAVILMFTLGLLSKSMLITAPLVLLLLDYWPLNRFMSSDSRQTLHFGQFWIPQHLLVEKIPLFLLSLASCIVTLFVPEKLAPSDELPFTLRVENAAVAVVGYIAQMIWPTKLAIPYPNPTNGFPLWETALALTLITGTTAGVLMWRRKYPYLVVGWLWYISMLLPVLGIIQISNYAHADRYTYLPQIGLAIAFAWLVGDLSVRWPHRKAILGIASAGTITALIGAARNQTSHWRNSEALWKNAISRTSDNAIAHYNLGNTLRDAGRFEEAALNYQKAVEIRPNATAAHNNLGSVLLRLGKIDQAINHYKNALRIDPGQIESIYHLGNAFYAAGRVEDAIDCYETALVINPDFTAALNNLASILATTSRASLRNGARAVELAERADRIANGANPIFAGTLATAYAEAGRFDEAIQTIEKAIRAAQAAGWDEFVEQARADLKLYRAGRAFHEKRLTP
jgi:tetratricopeptide (TPR) repeat protein